MCMYINKSGLNTVNVCTNTNFALIVICTHLHLLDF